MFAVMIEAVNAHDVRMLIDGREGLMELGKQIVHEELLPPRELNTDVPMEIDWKKKGNILGLIFLLDILVGVIFIGSTYFIDNYLVKLKEDLIEINPTTVFLFAGVMMPIIEEILFRFPLKYKRNYLVRGLDKLLGGRIKEKWGNFFKLIQTP